MLQKLIHYYRVIRSIRRETLKLKRSPDWAKLRNQFEQINPICEACGGSERIQIHHKKPFHSHPELELEPNLIALCMGKEECHLRLGHGNDFKSYNPYIEDDVKEYRVSSREQRDLIILRAKITRTR